MQSTDLFPIALGKLNYYPSSPQTTEKKQLNYRTALNWGNTINGINKHYLIDAESREQIFSARYGLEDDLEIGAHLPLLWRGSGVLDSFIYDWHNFWGFPQGPRAGTERDRYEIQGDRSDEQDFEFDERGLKLGDLRLSAKKLFTKGNESLPAISSEVLLSLPTGSYSTNGFDLLASLTASKKFGITYLYLGAFSSLSEKTRYEDIEFKRFRYGASATIEIALDADYSIICGLVYGSNYTSDISRLPNYQLYADLGLKYGITESSELELLIRENPAPDRGSSDFSFLIGFNSKLNL